MGSEVYQGSLGRSLRVPVTVTSETGRTFTASVFTQVNVTQDPNLRLSVEEGTLNEVPDPWTSARYNLAMPVVYHDEGLGLFALLAPESLRHQEFELRRRLLDQLGGVSEVLPEYVRRYRVIFGSGELARVEAELSASARGDAASGAELARLRKEVEDRERRLSEDRHKLEAMRLNLEELQSRLKEQEEALVRAGRLVAPSDDEPTTVVPREVFYGSVGAAPAAPAPPAPPAPPRGARPGRSVMPGPALTGESRVGPRGEQAGWSTGLESGWELEEEASPRATPPPVPTSSSSMAAPPPPSSPALATSSPSTSSASGLAAVSRSGSGLVSRSGASQVSVTDDMPRTFNRLKAGSRPWYHSEASGEVLLAYRLPEQRLSAFLQRSLKLYLQLHELEEFPLLTLLLVAHGEDEEAADDLWWPLDVRKLGDRRLLDRLQRRFALRVGLYGEDLQLRHVLTFQEPLELNAAHVAQLAERRLAATAGESVDFEAALRAMEAPGYERLGSMRHNFQRSSFEGLSSPGEARLAVGIVAYWSGAERFRYLIENRAFSLEWFAQIQERVVRAAWRFGVALPRELRPVALDAQLASDEAGLLRHLAATFAQVSLGLGGKQDLDALAEWENWQSLIEGMGELGLELEDELAQLARASLRRARRFVAEHDIPAELPEEAVEEALAGPLSGEHAAAVAPEPAFEAVSSETQIDAEGGLSDAPLEGLLELLKEPGRRLSAARQLLRRADAEGVRAVLAAADAMDDDELGLLSETLSVTAPQIEGVLIEALATDDPTVTYLAVFALSTMQSVAGRAGVLEVLQDEERAPDPGLFAEAISLYGEGMLDPLLAALKSAEGLSPEHPLVLLAGALGRAEGEDALAYLETEQPEVVAWAREEA